MKRIISAVFAVVLAFSLCACGNRDDVQMDNDVPGEEGPNILYESDDSTEPDDTLSEPETIIINGVDVKDEIETKAIDSTLYAEGASFIESLRYPDMPEGMHNFNYQYETDDDLLYDLLLEFDGDERHIREEFEELLHNDAIIVSWYSTDAVAFMLFIDSTDAVRFVGDEDVPELISMDEAPRIVDGEVYIPMQAFIDLTEDEIVIE